ncbi:MAG: PKD domain-containing protein [Actinomycetota bacterium]
MAIEPTTDTFGLFSSSSSCTSFAPVTPAGGGQPGRGRRPAHPSPEQLAAIAADRAMDLAQDPALEIAPSRIGLTGLDSFFWLAEAPRPVQATASAGGLSVTAEARPVQYVWDFGDDTDKVTEEPGRPWTRWLDGNVAHMYQTRARYEVAVEVVWSARWRIGAGAWEPLGFFSNSDTREYPVRQMIAMLVRAR